MAVHPPPDYTRITKALSDVAEHVNRGRRIGGFRRLLPSGQIQRGDNYMDGSRILIQQCRELMVSDDEDSVVATYNLARDSKATLNAGNLSRIRKFQEARNYRRLSKGAYGLTKRASDRALDNSVVGPMDGTDPPAGAPPTTPEESAKESDGTGLPAGAPPVTPEDPDRPPPHDPGTDLHATLSPGATGIGGSTDEFRDTYSFTYDQYFASSEVSIASYKTERTVNSRVTEGIESLNVHDAPVQGVEVPTAGPPGPSWMTDRAQEVDNLSHNLSNGLCSVSELFGADDYLDD